MTAADRPIPASGRFGPAWEAFWAEAQSLRSLLIRELHDSREGIARVLALQADGTRVPEEGGPPPDVPATAAATALLAPLDLLERLRPLEQAFASIEAYHRGVGDLIRASPLTAIASGPELLDGLDQAGSGVQRTLTGWRKDDARMPFAGAIERAWAGDERHRRAIERRLLAAFARGMREVHEVWETVRSGDDEPDDAPLMPDVLDQDLAAAIEELDALADGFSARAADKVIAAAAWRRTPVVNGRTDRGRLQHVAQWSSRITALEDELRLDRVVAAVEERMLELAAAACGRLDGERTTLLAVISDFVHWLDRRLDPGSVDRTDLPRDTPDVVPAVSRAAELEEAFRSAVAAVPVEIKVLRRIEPGPDRRALRVVAPRRMLSEALSQVARPRLRRLFAEVQERHVGLVMEIERARQVVEFAAEKGADADSVREALENARTLLSLDQDRRTRPLTAEVSELAAIVTSVFEEFRLLLGRSRVGVFTRLGRMGLRRGAGVFAAGSAAAAVSGGRRLWRGLRDGFQRFLVAIEWAPKVPRGTPEVVRRPYLPAEFALDGMGRDLPAIYRRLFRLEAVSDARFLVGRDDEMAALVEARMLWEQGRPVAVAVVGERGSGKTSLINCALERPFAGLPVIRGELSERLTDPAAVRNFLADLLGVPESSLVEAVGSVRQVVVLEECERFVLRRVGGFDGVREFQRLIAASSGATLWVAVMNRNAFRLLDAAVDLGSSFSHRIDVATARPAALRDAILVRHNLSGLRLRFEPPPVAAGRLGALRRAIGGGETPEQAFFQALARESAGLFRTAFQLWLAQIGGVQGGTVVMKPVRRPPIDEVIEELDQFDVFTLAAVMQHGSLTPDEHAAIFQSPLAASRAQLDDLLARELIEQDPDRPGFRVRPSALRVAREALHRRNVA